MAPRTTSSHQDNCGEDAALIGTRVEVSALGMRQYPWIHANHSYKSGGALEAHFGLGKCDRADLTVTLLSGKESRFANVRTNHFLDLNLIQEPASNAASSETTDES